MMILPRPRTICVHAVVRDDHAGNNALRMSSSQKSSIQCVSRAARLAAATLLLATASVLGWGCVESTIAAAGATAGFGLAQGQAESFIRGELKSARMISMSEARAAVLQAMAELQLEVREERVADYDGYVRGKANGGREVKVYLKSDSPVMTRFSIRVGIMGDVAVSRLVMTRIDTALGISSATSEPAEEHP